MEKKVPYREENIVRKGEIACYKQFLLFSQCFTHLYIFSASKCGIVNVWQWVKPYHTITTSNDLKKPFESIVRKGENAGMQHFLLFPQCFLLFSNQMSIFDSQ